MRKPLVIQLALLLIAAAIFVLGSSLNASAGKKCISIGEKRICFEDGKKRRATMTMEVMAALTTSLRRPATSAKAK
jgi:hypothetical protein